jgi:hypothetical protein
MTKIEELFEGLEIRKYERRDPSRWPRDTPLSSKVGTNFEDKTRSLGIVRSQTEVIELHH